MNEWEYCQISGEFGMKKEESSNYVHVPTSTRTVL